jgi:hypothetical protein
MLQALPCAATPYHWVKYHPNLPPLSLTHFEMPFAHPGPSALHVWLSIREQPSPVRPAAPALWPPGPHHRQGHPSAAAAPGPPPPVGPTSTGGAAGGAGWGGDEAGSSSSTGGCITGGQAVGMQWRVIFTKLLMKLILMSYYVLLCSTISLFQCPLPIAGYLSS